MKDQLQRTLDVDTIPERIVCLVPSLTEMLVDLGLKHKLLGVTKFCVHPQDIRTHAEVIGGTKNIKHDSIQALSPDFILANKEENELKAIERLSEYHPVYVSDINSIEDLLQLIRDLGELFSIPERSSQLADDIQTSFIKFSREARHQPTLKVAYFIWRDPWMVVGSSTFIDYMLKLNNFDNVYDDSARYPEVDIHQLKPVDYILLSSEPFPFKDQHKKEFEMNPDQIHIVDGEYFSWYGSRLLKAFDYFKQLRDKL